MNIWDILIYQGAFWEEALIWTDEEGNPQIINGPILMDIKNHKNEIVRSLGTSPRTGIVLGEEPGTLLFFLSHSETKLMTPGFYRYDLFVFDENNRRVKLAYGPVEVVGAVTTL